MQHLKISSLSPRRNNTSPSPGPGPAPEQTIRRQEWALKRDPFGHVVLYVRGLILGLVDDVVQKVDGEFSEDDRKTHAQQGRRLAHQYFGLRLKVSTSCVRACVSLDCLYVFI